jgi:phosphocarrier protein HPr
MIETTIDLQVTLHARPAGAFAKQAAGYQSKVEIGKDGKFVAAKSLIGIMSLGAKAGAQVTLRADGPDEEKALAELAEFLRNLSE